MPRWYEREARRRESDLREGKFYFCGTATVFGRLRRFLASAWCAEFDAMRAFRTTRRGSRHAERDGACDIFLGPFPAASSMKDRVRARTWRICARASYFWLISCGS